MFSLKNLARKGLSEILIAIHTSSFKKMHLKMSSGKWRSFCLGLNVLKWWGWGGGGGGGGVLEVGGDGCGVVYV